MLGGIYTALIVVIVVLSVSHAIDCSSIFHSKINGVRSIKAQMLRLPILSVLCISETIIASILGKSIIAIILFILSSIMWVVTTILGFLALKEEKKDALNVQSADLEIIDLDCEEMQND